jgi:hypothetical protein
VKDLLQFCGRSFEAQDARGAHFEPLNLELLLADPLEHPIQIIMTEFKQNRAAVRTLGGKIDFIELVQQRAHLAHFQFSIGPYHAMTGNGRKTLFQVLTQLVGLAGSHLPVKEPEPR